jgi:hypothetical protein
MPEFVFFRTLSAASSNASAAAFRYPLALQEPARPKNPLCASEPLRGQPQNARIQKPRLRGIREPF